jgi:DMSO/TMAO reductase YedYZ molybdopterin-dependent catalytic subunit
MSRLITRRNFLRSSVMAGSGLVLAGCNQFDFFADKANPARKFVESANVLTYQAQRALIGDQALAREYSASEIRQGQRPNGSTDPTTPEYLALREGSFADYRFRVIGLVDRPQEFTLDQLRNMPARSQITRHDCVEGWSCIAKWTGTPLGTILDMAGVRPNARFAVYHCFDNIERSLSGDVLYYTSSDLVDAYHPQSILSYGLNDQALPVSNGAPVRLRIERALGYKQPKYLHTVELVDSLASFGRGRGGYWEDTGYDWFGGI